MCPRGTREVTQRWLQDQALAGNINYGPAGIGSKDGRHRARAEDRGQGWRTGSKERGQGARMDDQEQGWKTEGKDGE